MDFAEGCASLTTMYSSMSAKLQEFTSVIQSSKQVSAKCNSLSSLDDVLAMHFNIRQILLAICGTVESGTKYAQSRPTQQLKTAYRTCQAAISRTLSAAFESMREMHRTSTATKSFSHPSEEAWFLQLWRFTQQMSIGVSMSSSVGIVYLVDLTSLLPIYDPMLTWIQLLTQQRSCPAMQSLIANGQPGLQWQDGAHSHVNVMLLHLSKVLSNMTQPPLAPLLSFFPNACIPKLCSLLCDISPVLLPGTRPHRDRAAADFENQTSESVWFMSYCLDVMFLEALDKGHDLGDLVCPAAIEVMKLAMVVVNTNPLAPHNIAERCLALLQHMLQAASRRSTTAAELVPMQTTTNQQLLSALLRYAANHSSALMAVTGAMEAILFYAWDDELVSNKHVSCVPSLLRHCHAHMGACMKKLRLPQSGRKVYSTPAGSTEELESLQSLMWFVSTIIHDLGELR